jgi:hypothetical protein
MVEANFSTVSRLWGVIDGPKMGKSVESRYNVTVVYFLFALEAACFALCIEKEAGPANVTGTATQHQRGLSSSI